MPFSFIIHLFCVAVIRFRISLRTCRSIFLIYHLSYSFIFPLNFFIFLFFLFLISSFLTSSYHFIFSFSFSLVTDQVVHLKPHDCSETFLSDETQLDNRLHFLVTSYLSPQRCQVCVLNLSETRLFNFSKTSFQYLP